MKKKIIAFILAVYIVCNPFSSYASQPYKIIEYPENSIGITEILEWNYEQGKRNTEYVKKHYPKIYNAMDKTITTVFSIDTYDKLTTNILQSSYKTFPKAFNKVGKAYIKIENFLSVNEDIKVYDENEKNLSPEEKILKKFDGLSVHDKRFDKQIENIHKIKKYIMWGD